MAKMIEPFYLNRVLDIAIEMIVFLNGPGLLHEVRRVRR
jgi:hypothetical protein